MKCHKCGAVEPLKPYHLNARLLVCDYCAQREDERRRFAGMILSGLAADPTTNSGAIGTAVDWADKLIAALNKEAADE